MFKAARNVLAAIAILASSLTVSSHASADIADTGDDSYVSSYTAAQVASGGSDESNPYTLLARNDWLKEVYGANPPAGFGQRLFGELRSQQALYPQQVAGAQPAPGIPVWRSIGPNGDIRTFNVIKLQVTDSGRLRTILPHPTDPNTVYVLSAGGGAWKTTNFTAPYPTWVAKTDGIFTTSGGAMAFGRDPNTLYLGLGDPFNPSPTAGGVMLRSTNGGDTWTPAPFINLPGASIVTDVKVDTSQAQDIVLVGTDGGLFRSTDGGLTYSQVPSIANASGDIVWSLVQTSAGWLAADAVGGVSGVLYLSTDHGATWQPISNTGNGYNNSARTTLAVGAPGDAVVYAFAENAAYNAQGDLFRSTDGGQTWTPVHLNSKVPTNPNPDQPNMNLMHRQAFYNQMILVDPTDSSRNSVYLGGNLSSAKTTDGGQTWTLLTNWLAQFGLPYAHADFHAAAFSSLGGARTVFFGSDGGLFVSQDGGATWSSNKNRGLVDTLHYSLAGNPLQPANMITGLQDLGTRVRQGSTGIFNQTFGGDGFGTAWSQSNGAVAMGSLYFDYIFSSTYDPQNIQTKWQYSFSGINNNDAFFFTPLASPSPAADRTGQVFYTATLQHIYRTTNGGGSWAPIFTTGQSGTTAFIRPVVDPLGISPLDTNHIAAAATGGRVLITTDGGATWKQPSLNTRVPGWLSFNSTVAWANNQVLYAGNVAPGYRPVRVAKSSDGGVDWAAATAGLPDVPVHQLLVSPADPTGNTVYAATFLGVYQTANGGQSWHLFGAGLPAVEVYGLYMPPDGSFLRIATYGRGIWDITP
jgi:photosystem II stability/assembly factor-like uncharacterized protein